MTLSQHLYSTKYLKVLVSVLAGIACLFLSKYSISIETAQAEIGIPWSLVFPFVISLAYGTKYGIWAGLTGGSIYPFYLFPENGWANVLSVFYLLLLIILSGVYSDSRKNENRKISLHLLLLLFTLTYVIVSYISLRYLYRVFLGFNPAFWVSNSIQSFPKNVLVQFFVKDLINFSLLIIFSDTLLKVAFIRKLLGLPVEYFHKKNGVVLLFSILVSLIVWSLLFLSDYYLLHLGSQTSYDYHSTSFFVLFWSGGILGRVFIWYHEKSLQSEGELIQAKIKAEESDRLKSAFLANMSHELRTPMNGILGFTSLLRQTDISDEEKEKYINVIEKSGLRLLDTVNDIIEISKIETGQVVVFLKELNLLTEIENEITFFKPEANKKGINLFFENDCDNGFGTFVSDPLKLNSILTNLIKNAIKFTQQGFIKVSLKCTENEVSISVADSGIGIQPERQAAIFNRFEQADIEDSQAFEGSGLGLAISKSYVEMLDGSIHLESTPGKGSVFTFTLPRKKLS